MKDPRPCTEGGQKHRVNEADVNDAQARALRESGDGSYSVTCIDCGKSITKGPRDLTFSSRIERP